MSEQIGPGPVLPGPATSRPCSPVATTASRSTPASMVDDEVRRIIEECERTASQTLGAHRDQLEALARALLEHETLDEADAYRIAGIERDPIPAPSL